MRKQLNFVFIGGAIAFASCGPNAADIAAKQKHIDDSVAAANKHHDDSLANAVSMKTKQTDDSAAAAKQQLQNNKQTWLQNELMQVKAALERANADLVVANDEMNHIKEFQFGRSHSDREQQIKNQALKIQQLQDRITSLRDVMNQKQSALAEMR